MEQAAQVQLEALEGHRQEARELRHRVDGQEMRLISLLSDLGERDRAIQATDVPLEARDQRIADLEQDQARREEREMRLREDAAQANGRAAAVEGQLAERDDRVRDMQRTLSIRQGQNRALQIAVDSFDRPFVALKRRARGARGGRAERNEIAASGLFDAAWYGERYPDVAEISMDPAMHYLLIGADLGYDPSTRFDTGAYLKANPDVAKIGANPLLHYLRHGSSEGRAPQAPGRSNAPPGSGP